MFSFPIKRLKGKGEWMELEWWWGENNEIKRHKRLKGKKKCGKGKGVARGLLHPCWCPEQQANPSSQASLSRGRSTQLPSCQWEEQGFPHFPRSNLLTCIFMEWDYLFLFGLLLMGIFKGMTVKKITKNSVLLYYLYPAPTKPNFPNFLLLLML